MSRRTVKNYTFSGIDGLPIYASAYEADNPRGVLQVLHGMAEHRKRYGEFAKKLNQAGFSFYIHDHRGHGDTAEKNNLPLGHLGDEDGWVKIREDVRRHTELIREENSELPIFLFGHSMGSFLGRDFILQNHDLFSGAIFSGTGFVKPVQLFLLKPLITLEKIFKGKKGKSGFVENMIFSSNNNQFKPVKTPHDWLSRDKKAVSDYYNDKRCGFSCTTKFYDDFQQGMKNVADTAKYRTLPEEFPIFFVSGGNDPVGGEVIAEVARDYLRVGLKDVEYKVYPGARHEMINELNKEEFFSDIIEWLEKRVD